MLLRRYHLDTVEICAFSDKNIESNFFLSYSHNAL